MTWQVKPLGEICEFQRGLTYAKGDEVAESDNVVLRANNIDLATNHLDLSDLRHIRQEIAIPNAKRVRKGSLIICTASGSKSHLGKVALIDDDYGYAFGGFMGQITPKPGLSSKYLFHLMTSDLYKDFISGLSDGANINNLKFDDLGRFGVPFPSEEEQHRIVVLLDEAFAGIATAKANAEKSLRNAREVSDSIAQQVLDSAGGDELPMELVAADDCSLSYGIVQPGNDVEDGLPVVRPVDLTRDVITPDGLKRIDPQLALGYQRTRLQGGELLLCVRGTTGTVSVAAPELEGANVTRGIVPIRFNPEQVTSPFGYHLMKSAAVQSQIRENTYGTALMQINIGDLRNIKVKIPPLSQQNEIAKRLDTLREEAAHIQSLYTRKLAALDQLKQSLLQRAFSGQL